MLAIPVLRSRVAPVFDWCSRIQIFPLEPSSEGARQELYLPSLKADQRLRVLGDHGVTTVICGALSAELQHYARQLRIALICGVAGEVDDVLHSYWQNRLDQPRFWLPGCRRARHYRRGMTSPRGFCRRQQREGAFPKQIPPSMENSWGNICLCPHCGATVDHIQDIPCFATTCPRCGQVMEKG
jgi:hypothetical protein